MLLDKDNPHNIKYKRYSFDLYRQLKNDPTVGVGCPGIKEIAFNKGRVPKQTPVGFNDPVSQDKINDCVSYCRNDVMELIDIFKDKREFFETIFYLHDNYGFKLTQTAASNIDRLFYHQEKPFIDLPKWRKALARVIREIMLYDTITLDSREGGIHGAEPSCRYTNAYNLDVASQYPSIIINFGLLGEQTELFKRMRDERLRIKKSDPVAAGGLKIILNTCYGVLNGDKGYFKMEHKDAGTFVCIYGQYSICTLMLSLLKAGATIIQINTDGVMFKGIDESTINDIVKKWESDFSMLLELDKVETVIQKDVNDYVAVLGDGKIKTKGGDLGNSLGRRTYKKNKSIVMDKMVLNILLGRPIMETIEPYDYARFLRPTKLFPTIRFGDRYLQEGVVVLPWDESGDIVIKVKPSGEESRFTNIVNAISYNKHLKVPESVVKACQQVALDKVYGRYKKNGELYATSTPWIENKELKDFFMDLLALS
jgi:hypothetical protein